MILTSTRTVCENTIAASYRFVVPRKVTMDPQAESIRGFRWLFSALQAGRDLTGKVTIRHAGSCGRCGRTLTVPASLDSGIGPVCADKMGIPYGEGEARPFDPWSYLLAGNATITVTSERTGQRYTYKVRQAEGREGEASAPYFVSLLTGPDNDADYRWMGMIFPG